MALSTALLIGLLVTGLAINSVGLLRLLASQPSRRSPSDGKLPTTRPLFSPIKAAPTTLAVVIDDGRQAQEVIATGLRQAAVRHLPLRVLWAYRARPVNSDAAGAYLRHHDKQEGEQRRAAMNAVTRSRQGTNSAHVEVCTAPMSPQRMVRHFGGGSTVVAASAPRPRPSMRRRPTAQPQQAVVASASDDQIDRTLTATAASR